MKNTLLSAFIILAFIGCNKSDDSNTPTTNPADSKPTITIEMPTGNVSPNGNTIDLKIKYTDKVEMLSTTIVMTAEAISNGAYFTDTRQLNGTSDEIVQTVQLQEVNLLGNHRITVTANNDNGKQEFVEQNFVLVDEEDPIINVTEFYSDLSDNPGTPHSKFNFKVTDNYVLKSVRWFIYLTDASGTEIAELYFDEADFIKFTNTFEYNEEFNAVNANSGDHYKGVIEVEDMTGRKARYDSQIMQFF